VIVNGGGEMMVWVNYSSYGVPIGLSAGDTDSDGDCDQTDINNIDAAISYDVRYDLDLDGDVDATDSSRASTTFQGTTLGWGVLSSSSVSNRKGYAGYEYDEAVSKYHVRNRVFDPALGRWIRRDPLGYVDGMSLYEYVGSIPMIVSDQMGLARCSGCVDNSDDYSQIIPSTISPITKNQECLGQCRYKYSLCNKNAKNEYTACIDNSGFPACLGSCKGKCFSSFSCKVRCAGCATLYSIAIAACNAANWANLARNEVNYTLCIDSCTYFGVPLDWDCSITQ